MFVGCGVTRLTLAKAEWPGMLQSVDGRMLSEAPPAGVGGMGESGEYTRKF